MQIISEKDIYIIVHVSATEDVVRSTNHATLNTLWVSAQPDLLH
jgi:hypothetical protein